jgi:hypothetical protein
VDVVRVGWIGGVREVRNKEAGEGSKGMDGTGWVVRGTFISGVWCGGEWVGKKVFKDWCQGDLFEGTAKVGGAGRGFGCGRFLFIWVGFGLRT